MKITLLIVAALFSMSNAMASEKKPIPPKDASCPSGYYRDAGYCVPGKMAKPAIEKRGPSCPIGYYSEAGYCVKNK